MDVNRGEVGSDAVHVPVMRRRVVELLAPALASAAERGRVPVHVDATLGMGGHAEAVLDARPDVVVVGIDRDPQALAMAGARLARHGERVHLAHAVHDEIDEVLDGLGIGEVDSVLLDLGLSSLQIDRVERGFAYSVDAPLDMRMDQSGGPTAADILNEAEPARLRHILSAWGQERYADRITRAIVAARPLRTSSQLVEVILAAIPAAARHAGGGHPARRTFQALRIAVNDEMGTLPRVVPAALERLSVGGRMAVLAYHSLEDRPVKEAFRRACLDQAPPGLPVVPDDLAARFRAVTRGAERPDEAELADNPRSASARLRVVERVRPDAGSRPHPRSQHER